jgi:uncharacterized protein (DUF934 family)
MPRHLLRDGQIVADDWQFLTEIEGAGVEAAAVEAAAAIALTEGIPNPPSGASTIDPTASLIIPFDRWTSERERWLTHTGRLGVALLPAHKVEALAPDLAHFTLVAAEFPGPSDGRGYTQGRLLRERYKFTGELRAAGYVRRDQLFFLARCGFNSFQLAANELDNATTAFSTYSAEYQPANDEGLPAKLKHR